MSVVILLASLVLASVPQAGDVVPPANDLVALDWMAGRWVGESDGVRIEEVWLEPAGNSMLALSRAVADGRLLEFEFLRLVADESGITYLASPAGLCPPTPFALVELGFRRAVFANADHDFPQKITYWREGDTLHARVEGVEDGEPSAFELHFTRR